MLKIGDDVLVTMTREAGTVPRVDRLGAATLYWLVMAASDSSRAPIDLGGPFTSDELRAGRQRR